MNESEKKFEIVFASSDQNEAAFKEYFNTMPFLALPFDSEVKNELSEFYDIEGTYRTIGCIVNVFGASQKSPHIVGVTAA